MGVADASLNLLIIRASFVCGTFSFALRMLFVFFPLFFLAAGAGCPLSLSPISTVVWLKCHRLLQCCELISCRTIHKYNKDRNFLGTKSADHT
jgi:hypothetical protein